MYVATTRARDHLIISLYRSARVRKSEAARIEEFIQGTDHLWHAVTVARLDRSLPRQGGMCRRPARRVRLIVQAKCPSKLLPSHEAVVRWTLLWPGIWADSWHELTCRPCPFGCPVLWSVAQPPYLSTRFTRLMSSTHELRSSSVRSAALCSRVQRR